MSFVIGSRLIRLKYAQTSQKYRKRPTPISRTLVSSKTFLYLVHFLFFLVQQYSGNDVFGRDSDHLRASCSWVVAEEHPNLFASMLNSAYYRSCSSGFEAAKFPQIPKIHDWKVQILFWPDRQSLPRQLAELPICLIFSTNPASS